MYTVKATIECIMHDLYFHVDDTIYVTVKTGSSKVN